MQNCIERVRDQALVASAALVTPAVEAKKRYQQAFQAPKSRSILWLLAYGVLLFLSIMRGPF